MNLWNKLCPEQILDQHGITGGLRHLSLPEMYLLWVSTVKIILTALINLKALWRYILIPMCRLCNYITENWKNTQQLSSEIGICGFLLENILLIQTHYFPKCCHFEIIAKHFFCLPACSDPHGLGTRLSFQAQAARSDANGQIPKHFTDFVAVWISVSRRQRKATTVIVQALFYAVVNELRSISFYWLEFTFSFPR